MNQFEPTKLLAKVFSPLKKIPFLPILIDEQLKIYTLFIKPKVFGKMIDVVKFLKSIPDVKTKYHRYGGLEFTIKHAEICHLHGDGLLDVLLNHQKAKELIENTEATQHHVIKNSGWISYQICKTSDLKEVIGIINQAILLRGKT